MADNKEKQNKIAPLLSLKGVVKDYKVGQYVTKVLKGIDLDVQEGEFLVILGESGCGKTTLLNIIGGMDRADAGEVYFNGKDLQKVREQSLCNYRRHNVGFIFQSYNLMPNLNVVQNLKLIAELVKNPMDIDKVLSLVKLSDKKTNFPSELSGGQQQRVSIARALVKNPKLILADEPTAALDYETSIEVLEALEDIHNDGTTIIMVSHNVEITKMATRVIKIRSGQIVEDYRNNNPLHAKELDW